MHDLCLAAPSQRKNRLIPRNCERPLQHSNTHTIVFILRRFAEHAKLYFVFTCVPIWDLLLVSSWQLLTSSNGAAHSRASVFPDPSTVFTSVITQLPMLANHHIYVNSQGIDSSTKGDKLAHAIIRSYYNLKLQILQLVHQYKRKHGPEHSSNSQTCTLKVVVDPNYTERRHDCYPML